MKIKFFLFILFTALSQSSVAGPFTDKLSICLVNNTSQADKSLLVKWIYAAISSHPEVRSMSNISVKKGNELNRETAALFTTLLTSRCYKETRSAIKYEGAIAFKTSFGVLGQVAMKGLIKNPDVNRYISGLDKYVDPKTLRKKLSID